MKCFFILSITCLLWSPLAAQVDAAGKMMAASSDIKEKLVTLALQNPDLEIADRQIKIAQYNLKEAKGWWLNNISLSFNANDFTVKRLMGKKQDNGQLYPIYPIYNVGLNIPIGGVFSKPAATKAAREGVAIARAQRNNTYRQIRTEVLSAYEDYLSNQELLTIQSQITESAYSDFLQARQKFSNGQISVDNYNGVAQQYHNQLISRVNAQHNFNLTKIKLEALIGVPISSVVSTGSVMPNNTGQVPADTTATH